MIVVQTIDTRALSLIIPLLLMAVALYVLVSPRMSDEDAHQRVSARGYAPVGAAIGAYDGFFGPGTGSFFTATPGRPARSRPDPRHRADQAVQPHQQYRLGAVLRASAARCSGCSACAWPAARWLGGWIGSHTAMRFGARLIRPLLVILSLGLTARLLWSYFAA